ncbi:hypothetical protein RM717_18665 [Streptomyces griseus]|nr:hypothetical protein [Streptomyces griseus]MDT0492533.1 hypothetical protein [Streptomyces griseus]
MGVFITVLFSVGVLVALVVFLARVSSVKSGPSRAGAKRRSSAWGSGDGGGGASCSSGDSSCGGGGGGCGGSS